MNRSYRNTVGILLVLGSLTIGWRANKSVKGDSSHLSSAPVVPQNSDWKPIESSSLQNCFDRPQAKERVLPLLKEIHSFKTHPMMEVQFEEIYEKLLSEKENIEELKKIVLREDDTTKLYGRELEVARVSAIDALGYLATQGQFEPIEFVIQIQSKLLQAREKPLPSEIADLSALFLEWIEAKGADRVENDLTSIREHFSVGSKLDAAFIAALGHALGWKTVH